MKQAISKEFGHNLKSINVHVWYENVLDMVYLKEISNYDNESDILFVTALGASSKPEEMVMKALSGIKMMDVMFLNTNEESKQKDYGENFYKFNIDEEPIEPKFIDFHGQNAGLSKAITELRVKV